MIAFVDVGGGWSIAEIDEDCDGLMWWCGEHEEWVSPHSSHWQLLWKVENHIFPSRAAAVRFAKRKGWVDE